MLTQLNSVSIFLIFSWVYIFISIESCAKEILRFLLSFINHFNWSQNFSNSILHHLTKKKKCANQNLIRTPKNYLLPIFRFFTQRWGRPHISTFCLQLFTQLFFAFNSSIPAMQCFNKIGISILIVSQMILTFKSP